MRVRVRVHDALLTHTISGPTLALAVTVRERERERESGPAGQQCCCCVVLGCLGPLRATEEK